MRPRLRKPGESIKDYRAMVKRMEDRFEGRRSTPTPKRSSLTPAERNAFNKSRSQKTSTPSRNPTQTKPYIARPPKKSSTSSLGKLFSKAKPASTSTPTSLFGSVARGPKKYNQAAYLSGLNTPSNTKKQSIYKPYAKGGGIRKPKYKD